MIETFVNTDTLLHSSLISQLGDGHLMVFTDSQQKISGIIAISDDNTLPTIISQRIKNMLKKFKQNSSTPQDIKVKVITYVSSGPIIDVIIETLNTYTIQYKQQLLYKKNINKIKIDNQQQLIYIAATAKKTVLPRNGKIKVLIIDDSMAVLKILKNVISKDERFEVCGIVEDVQQAEETIINSKPDVITLDIQMPIINGVDFLKQVIMPKYKIPTIMISSMNIEDSDSILNAIEEGAFAYLKKPSLQNLADEAQNICETIFEAHNSKVKGPATRSMAAYRSKKSYKKVPKNLDLLLIGASTGGTIAINKLLESFPPIIPAILIILHIPEGFSRAFAERLNHIFPYEVREAKHDDILRPNLILVAPGGIQTNVINANGKMTIELKNDPPVNRHRPSVDYTFHSCLNLKRKELLAVILTGMGADGAKGINALYEKGHFTIAQDEESCVVFGMPRVAIQLGGIDKIRPLSKIAATIFPVSNIKSKVGQQAT